MFEYMKQLVVFISLLLVILFLRLYYFYSTLEVPSEGESVVFAHIFLRDGKIGNYSQTFQINDITVITDKYPQYLYGDVVVVSGVVSQQDLEFSDGTSLSRLILDHPRIEVTPDKPIYLSVVTSVRQKIVSTFEQYLPPDEAGLLLGIVFGVREGISPELSEVFRSTGVLHVVAASGANIALIGGFFMLLFGRIGSRYIQLSLVLFFIAFYALLSGGEASILRASLMAGFAYSAAILGRQYSALWGLAFAAYVLLLIEPLIWRDVGFLLSLTSTLGIVLLQSPIHRRFSFLRLPIEDFSTSIGATVGNIPVLLFFFLSYPVLSVVINLLILWTVPYLMILGGLGALGALVGDTLAAPFLFLSLPLLSYFLWVVQVFPQDIVLTVEEFSVYFVLAYYCFLFAGISFIQMKQSKFG